MEKRATIYRIGYNRLVNYFKHLIQSGFKTVSFAVGFLMAVFVSTNCLAGPGYSSGMAAYMKGDFELAQEFWLQASQHKDAKAMFNLGLLHSNAKIANASPDKADRWFKLAGKNGYAAADYHYAKQLIVRGAASAEVATYLQRAATNGSFPAKELLGINSEVAVNEVAQQANSTSAKRAFTTTNDYLTEDWLRTRNSSTWTIQMLAFADETKVRNFIAEHNLRQDAAYFKEQTNNGVLYKLVYGIYDSKEHADKARNGLSSTLRQHGPWLRSMASVKRIIQQMAGQVSQ